MGISKEYVSKPHSHCSARSSLDSKSNILVNNEGRACLSGFSPPTLTSDQPVVSLSPGRGGTVRWMAPELLLPEKFGLNDDGPTKKSDCYSLGMVMYEVLSGEAPFAQDTTEYQIICRVLDGNRPRRPRGRLGARFAGGLWDVLGLCWEHRPDDRPSVDVVLQHLEDATRLRDRLLMRLVVWGQMLMVKLTPQRRVLVSFLCFIRGLSLMRYNRADDRMR